MSDIPPTGHLLLYSAMRRMAGLEDYAPDHEQWWDGGDALIEAEAMEKATNKLRELLIDGAIRGYRFEGDGKLHEVPPEIWVSGNACLTFADYDPQGGKYSWFHPDGIWIGEHRQRVFLIEREFEKVLQGEQLPPSISTPPTRRKPGRRMGDGAFNDGRWFDEMEGYVRDKMSPHRAALEIVHVHGEKVDGISAGSDPANVAHRIYKKYMETDRLKKPPALD